MRAAPYANVLNKKGIKMKYSNYLIFTLSMLLASGIALAESRFIAIPGTVFAKDTSSPARSAARISWRDAGSAYPIDLSVWRKGDDQHQWGIEYLIEEFGLVEYTPSRETVLVVDGRMHRGNDYVIEEATHYIYNPNGKDVCLIHFSRRWEKRGSNTSYIGAHLLGCNAFSKPQ